MIWRSLRSPRQSHSHVRPKSLGHWAFPFLNIGRPVFDRNPSEIFLGSPRNAYMYPSISAGAGFLPNIAAAAQGWSCYHPHEERKRKLLIPHSEPGLHSFSHRELVCLIKDLFEFIHTFSLQLSTVRRAGQGWISANRVHLETWLPLALTVLGLAACRTSLSLMNDSVQEIS